MAFIQFSWTSIAKQKPNSNYRLAFHLPVYLFFFSVVWLDWKLWQAYHSRGLWIAPSLLPLLPDSLALSPIPFIVPSSRKLLQEDVAGSQPCFASIPHYEGRPASVLIFQALLWVPWLILQSSSCFLWRSGSRNMVQRFVIHHHTRWGGGEYTSSG